MQAKKIKVTNPVVEMLGDEMTAVFWPWITNTLINPYVDIKVHTFDLSLLNRNNTDDQVTLDAAKAIMEFEVGIKCATITPDDARMKEFSWLTKKFPSPNGRIRNILDGVVFREPIICKNIPPYVKTWVNPIIIGRHGYGDIYKAAEIDIQEPGKLTFTFTPDANPANKVTVVVNEFKGGGIGCAMFNTDTSITGFAHTCMKMALEKGWPLWFGAKDTILKIYDGRFKAIFEQVYATHYKNQFEEKGIDFRYFLIDNLVAELVKTNGNVVVALKNYDGDVESDKVAQGFGSLGMMTSVLRTPSGKYFETEAAHGTVTAHFRQHQQGHKTSTNPVASIFAWTQGLKIRGELDNNKTLIEFTQALEQSVIDTIEGGQMTKDLAILAHNTKEVEHGTHYLYTQEFLNAVKVKHGALVGV